MNDDLHDALNSLAATMPDEPMATSRIHMLARRRRHRVQAGAVGLVAVSAVGVGALVANRPSGKVSFTPAADSANCTPLQAPDPNAPPPAGADVMLSAKGTVTAVSGDAITLDVPVQPGSNRPLTVTVDSSTTFSVDGQTVPSTALTTGQVVGISAESKPEGGYVVRSVEIAPTAPATGGVVAGTKVIEAHVIGTADDQNNFKVMGTVREMTSDALVLDVQEGTLPATTTRIAIVPSTELIDRDQKCTTLALAPGDSAVAAGTRDGDALTAQVVARVDPPSLQSAPEDGGPKIVTGGGFGVESGSSTATAESAAKG
jgi:hypothetical protein